MDATTKDGLERVLMLMLTRAPLLSPDAPRTHNKGVLLFFGGGGLCVCLLYSPWVVIAINVSLRNWIYFSWSTRTRGESACSETLMCFTATGVTPFILAR